MIQEPYLTFFEEPKLTFGYQQKVEDPRDGLTLFGPFSKDQYEGQVNIGVIGPRVQREYIIDYLKRIHKPVISKNPDLARPYFPGLEAAFGVFINFSSVQQIDIDPKKIDDFLKYEDSHQRVHNLSNLYSEPLNRFANQEQAPVSVWFVGIPDDVYKFGRPKSRLEKSEENIQTEKISSKDKKSNQMFLFDDLSQLKEAYQFEVNFHNQLKAKVLGNKVVTQIIRESTIAYDQIWADEEKVKYEKLFDTAKAWNISTTLYYKYGGIPWKLGDIRKNVCYLGLVYKKLEESSSNKNACCAAQMFLDSGDGMVFRGNIGPWYNKKLKEFHIGKKDAKELLEMSLEGFRQRSETGDYPEEVFIHAKTYFDDEEWQGFMEAAHGKSRIIGVRIRNDGNFKLYRDFSYCVPRGTALIYTNAFAYLWSNGYVPRLQTQMGSETPNPISVEVTRGQKDIETVCKDILALTKLNYNACIFADGSPVTLRFAESIGEVLTAGKNIKSEVLPFKHYV